MLAWPNLPETQMDSDLDSSGYGGYGFLPIKGMRLDHILGTLTVRTMAEHAVADSYIQYLSIPKYGCLLRLPSEHGAMETLPPTRD